MQIQKKPFGKLKTGENVRLFTLINNNGLQVSITDYGATIVSVMAPDRKNHFENVVLGFDSVEEYQSENYLKSNPYFGCTIGRYSNRIKNGRIKIGNNTYQINQNEGSNTLHGGKIGFDKKLWSVTDEIDEKNGVGIEMSLVSPDGDQGYPGKLNVTVRFELDDKNKLDISYRAVSDKDTIVSLTNHSYFNLSGDCKDTVKNHLLMIPSEKVLILDTEFIPTGEIDPVKNTSMDFYREIRIGDAMRKPGNDKITGNYAHTFVLDRKKDELVLTARLKDADSGRVLTIHTVDPGILIYTGDGLDGSLLGKNGIQFKKWKGICLETQQLPDAPNHKNFPSGILAANTEYSSHTVYSFETK